MQLLLLLVMKILGVLVSVDVLEVSHWLLLVQLRLLVHPAIYASVVAQNGRALHGREHLILLLVGFLVLLA